MIVKIFEIQSKIKITTIIRNNFEKKLSSNMTSTTKNQNFVSMS